MTNPHDTWPEADTPTLARIETPEAGLASIARMIADRDRERDAARDYEAECDGPEGSVREQ